MKLIKKLIICVINAIIYIGITNLITVSAKTVRTEFINADIYVNISQNIPTITGTVSCAEGKTINFAIKNSTDNIVVAAETVTHTDGQYSIAYTLPSLESLKQYEINVSCLQGDYALTYMAALTNASFSEVNASATITTASNVDIDVRLRCGDMLDKSVTVEGERDFLYSIPDFMLAESFHLTVQGFEEKDAINPVLPKKSANLSIVPSQISNEQFRVIVGATNILWTSDTVFVLEYNNSIIEPISYCGLKYQNSTELGTHGNIKILSNENGKIRFRIINTTVPEEKVWSGLLNVFKFRLINNNQSAFVIFYHE